MNSPSYTATPRFWLVLILAICVICACSGCGGSTSDEPEFERTTIPKQPPKDQSV